MRENWKTIPSVLKVEWFKLEALIVVSYIPGYLNKIGKNKRESDI
jgi:hypothetical protein